MFVAANTKVLQNAAPVERCGALHFPSLQAGVFNHRLAFDNILLAGSTYPPLTCAGQRFFFHSQKFSSLPVAGSIRSCRQLCVPFYHVIFTASRRVCSIASAFFLLRPQKPSSPSFRPHHRRMFDAVTALRLCVGLWHRSSRSFASLRSFDAPL